MRGLTKLHPHVPERLRGTYAGLAHPAAIEHLVKLGVTAVELLPVQEFVSEPFARVEDVQRRCAETLRASTSSAERERLAALSSRGARLNKRFRGRFERWQAECRERAAAHHQRELEAITAPLPEKPWFASGQAGEVRAPGS